MLRDDFPLLIGTKTTYLDTAASAQKPTVVLEAMETFYRTAYANPHRGQCDIATHATAAYEQARQTVADFIHADSHEIIFTKGTTEGINLLANGYAERLHAGDEVLVCIAEHHADFVPWQQACRRTGATFKVFDILPDGRIDWADFEAKLSEKTRLVAVAQVSNVLGLVNPIRDIIERAHAVGADVLIDGAQSIAHMPVDVRELDCDYYAFSGHKIYGPTGIGVLYGKKEKLETLPPYQFGGDMIKTVSVDQTTFADVPARFEAGTTPFVEAVGLAEAIRYVSRIGMDKIAMHEEALTKRLVAEIERLPGAKILGSCPDKHGLCAFNIAGVHPADLAFVLSKENICVRVGHHCAMPIHKRLGVKVSLRASLGLYNDMSDIEAFIQGILKALDLLGVKS